MHRRLALIALSSALAVLGLAPVARADTAVMGSTLANTFDGGISTGPTLSAQLSFDPATSPNPVVSPADGVITDWKVKSADDGAIYTLVVLRPNGPVSLVTATNTNFTAIRSVQAPTAVPAGTFGTTPTGVIFDYPASLPISTGDYIGVLTGGADDDVPQHTTNGLAKNLFANNFAGQPANGTAANLLSDEQHDLLLQATIKFSAIKSCKVPSVVGQPLAAATAAIAAANCTSTATTQALQLRAIKKKFSKKKKNRIKASNNTLKAQDGLVLSQSPPPGTTAEPAGPPVILTVGEVVKPPKKKNKKHRAVGDV
jgi:hypothetical protein